MRYFKVIIIGIILGALFGVFLFSATAFISWGGPVITVEFFVLWLRIGTVIGILVSMFSIAYDLLGGE